MATSSDISIILTEDDIPGAVLDFASLESYTNHALQWWLLCRGVSSPASWKKAQIVNKIYKVMKQKLDIVDVDGSYLYRKEQQLISQGMKMIPPPLPAVPLTGWELLNADNFKEKNVPRLKPGLLYTYLAKGCERISGHGAFRALHRGYIHWASGRLEQIQVNLKHPSFCHVRCSTSPSMRAGCLFL